MLSKKIESKKIESKKIMDPYEQKIENRWHDTYHVRKVFDASPRTQEKGTKTLLSQIYLPDDIVRQLVVTSQHADFRRQTIHYFLDQLYNLLIEILGIKTYNDKNESEKWELQTSE